MVEHQSETGMRPSVKLANTGEVEQADLPGLRVHANQLAHSRQPCACVETSRDHSVGVGGHPPPVQIPLAIVGERVGDLSPTTRFRVDSEDEIIRI